MIRSEEPVRLREVVVVGGGCYGSFYTGQLRRAIADGRLTMDRLVVVDRDAGCQVARDKLDGVALVVEDWGAFFDRWLDRPGPTDGPDDAVVPSPLMPHLMAEWLVRLAGRTGVNARIGSMAADSPVGTPYEVSAPDGNRYVSFADWICPTHCVEPFTCPATRGPRTWEMGDTLHDYVKRDQTAPRLGGPALFVTRHRVYGVGMFDAADARRGRALLEQSIGSGLPARLLVATISACHGAVSAIELSK